ncbi:MAG: FliO/MopB family protein [Bdellovibrionia bacterium]
MIARKTQMNLVQSVWILIGLSFFAPRFSHAVVSLKSVEVKGVSEFLMHFDGKVDRSWISSELQDDLYQLSIKNVGVYPAKIVPVTGKFVSKIFAYQYSPQLIRCRFNLRGKAGDFKNKFRLQFKGESLQVSLDPAFVQARENAGAGEQKIESVKAVENSPQDSREVDEKLLLEKVMKENSAAAPSEALDQKNAPPSETQLEQRTESNALRGQEKPRLAGGKPLPPLWPVFWKMILVSALFCLFIFALKKLKKFESKSNWVKAVGKFAKKGLLKDRDMIEVIATHHLDPKKSLAVVRVAGQLLVLGVSNDSINLITQISEGDPVSGDSSSSGPLGPEMMFSDLLQSEARRPDLGQDEASLIPSASSRIKNRLQGLKPL